MASKLPYPYPYSKAPALDSRITIPRPRIDPSLAPLVDSYLLPEDLDVDFMRGTVSNDAAAGDFEPFVYTANTVLAKGPHLQHTEHTVSGPDGNDINLSVFAPKERKLSSPFGLPALYHVHGGGMVSGDRFTALPELLDLIPGIDCVLVSVEYRLSPETRAPGPAEDCYAGLVWVSENAAKLGIDPARIVVWGVSGGAALAAAACLMARDRNAFQWPIHAQILVAPMLDDRDTSLSHRQFEYGSPFCGVSNRQAWDLVLGPGIRGTDKVTAYQAPGRAASAAVGVPSGSVSAVDSLANLPATYIDVGECEVFRDAAVEYAVGLWRGGTTCELHVWPGAVHLFDAVDNPGNALIHGAFVAKQNWLGRMLQPRAEGTKAE